MPTFDEPPARTIVTHRYRRFPVATLLIFLHMPTFLLTADVSAGDDARQLEIKSVDAMPFFRRPRTGEPLCQDARIVIACPGAGLRAKLEIHPEGMPARQEDLDRLKPGENARTIQIPDLPSPTTIRFQLLTEDELAPLAELKVNWKPSRKWKVYCVPYSHEDLGYRVYPHQMRRNVQDYNVELALRFCRETDAWDDDDRFRWTLEHGASLYTYLQTHTPQEVAELVRRIAEGRIDIAANHSTPMTENCSYEVLTRLFYHPNRYLVDWLGIAPRKTMMLDDVTGITWPVALCAKEAGIPFGYFGRNRMQDGFQPAGRDPFFWQPADGDTAGRFLVEVEPYGSQVCEDTMRALLEYRDKQADYPYDVALLAQSSDFAAASTQAAGFVRDWNAKWAYPHLVSATATMYFEAIAKQSRDTARSFAKDSPHAWADECSGHCAARGEARKLEYEVPAAEKLATITTALCGRGYPWLDLWQAYNRLLDFDEHTMGVPGDYHSTWVSQSEYAQYYETENVEKEANVCEARTACDRVMDGALGKLESLIATDADQTVMVVNSLNWNRSDLVRLKISGLPPHFRLVDVASGETVEHEEAAPGEVLFWAANVPSLGYKCFRVEPAPSGTTGAEADAVVAGTTTLENRYYKLLFDEATGGIRSIFDKELNRELVDAQADQRFNEYLYKRVVEQANADGKWLKPTSARLSGKNGRITGTMTATVHAEGCRNIRQTVILYDRIKRIDFVQDLDKAPSGMNLVDYGAAGGRSVIVGKEGVLYSLPFAIPNFRIRHELAGGVAEPFVGQFPGSTSSYHAIQHWTDLFNDQYGVTLATIEAPLVEYGRPFAHASFSPDQSHMCVEERNEYPDNSHVYMYLMNNMSNGGACIDQSGTKTFQWSIRSHQGDWKQGQAAAFGWEYSHPLTARLITGRHPGILPRDACSFVRTDKSNVVLSCLKAAEANGSGLILRFHELLGEETTVRATLSFLAVSAVVESANETTLLEDDLPVPVQSGPPAEVTFSIRPLGVKTIRVKAAGTTLPSQVAGLAARAAADTQVDLAWHGPSTREPISHYRVYRSDSPDFSTGLSTLVGQATEPRYEDRPKVHGGGWPRHRVDPDTIYYYRVAAVDRWNREGPASETIRVKTLASSEKSLPPGQVQALRVIYVSPLSPDNYFNLIFYTNAESNIKAYEVYRGTQPGFEPASSNLVGTVDMTAPLKTRNREGAVEFSRTLYTHQMFQDKAVEPGRTYYYRVCAVDFADNRGAFSHEASGHIEPKAPGPADAAKPPPAGTAIEGLDNK